MAGQAKSKGRKCQQKCYPLEPVLEDCVSNVDEVPRKPCQQGQLQRLGKGPGLLSKVRDGYVKLMNNVACSADFSGVSAAYGCSTAHTDFPGAAAMAAARAYKQDEEMEQAAAAARESH